MPNGNFNQSTFGWEIKLSLESDVAGTYVSWKNTMNLPIPKLIF